MSKKSIKLFGIGTILLFVMMTLGPVVSAYDCIPGNKDKRLDGAYEQDGKLIISVKVGALSYAYVFLGVEQRGDRLVAIFGNTVTREKMYVPFPFFGPLVLTTPLGIKVTINRDGTWELQSPEKTPKITIIDEDFIDITEIPADAVHMDTTSLLMTSGTSDDQSDHIGIWI